jgi:TPR repeat protein
MCRPTLAEIPLRADPALFRPRRFSERRFRLLVGFLYMNGRGLPLDYVQAHMWLNLAAAAGEAKAASSRNTLARLMTPSKSLKHRS